MEDIHTAPDEEVLFNLAEFFKVFGDSTRIRLLYALLAGDRSVTGIAEDMGVTQSAVSHQLRLLKSARLVKFRREGKEIWYSLDDSHIKSILALGIEHISEGNNEL